VSLYRSVDAFVLPSRGEGWGRPYMEAMSMGLPVIATNWSGPTEFVNE
jgi:glycosyltransferase involved in cell wall biosynthesis